MTHVRLIDADEHDRRRFDASLHGAQLAERGSVGHGRSADHDALVRRLEQRRGWR